jgi:hypothetical protein
LYSHYSIEYVVSKLLAIPRLLGSLSAAVLANRGSISAARYRLGAKVLEQLFKRICRPMASEETQGAFAFGYRLVAVDGTVEDVADTDENMRYFGRSSGAYGASAFPQAQCAYLCECGTRVIFDASITAYTSSDQRACERLLRSLSPEMLLMFDSGLYSFDFMQLILAQGAVFLGRLPGGVKPKQLCRLADASSLVRVAPSAGSRGLQYPHAEPLTLRLLTYTFDDPQRPGYLQEHRLITNLLDDALYPALDLICLYHERWEIELSIDEMDTHQRQVRQPMRSRKPVGVIQEFYALLIAYFLIRSLIHRAALQQQLDPDRISFLNSLRLICDALPLFQLLHPDGHAQLWVHLFTDMAHFILPARSNRINPRVIKRQRLKFPRKKAKHRHPLQPLKPFREALVMI